MTENTLKFDNIWIKKKKNLTNLNNLSIKT